MFVRSTYSISMLRSSTKAEKVPTSSSRKMLYLIQYCTSVSQLHSANVPEEQKRQTQLYWQASRASTAPLKEDGVAAY